MRMYSKYALLIFALLLCTQIGFSRDRRQSSKGKFLSDTLNAALYTDSYLDSVSINKAVMPNDYCMVGFEYGVGLNKTTFNPTKESQQMVQPGIFGVTFTSYGKMFNSMPYFGFQIGLFYGQDGYKFKEDEETGTFPNVDGAVETVFDYIEMPLLAQFHFDAWKIKIMGSVGPYFGYRLKVHREGLTSLGFDSDYADKFHDYDRRLDYGVKFGGGVGIMLDPLEFHITAMVRYGVSTIYDPDYYSKYYYRYAHPFDIGICFGVHYQLGRRTGRTKASLRRDAKEIVWNAQPSE